MIEKHLRECPIGERNHTIISLSKKAKKHREPPAEVSVLLFLRCFEALFLRSNSAVDWLSAFQRVNNLLSGHDSAILEIFKALRTIMGGCDNVGQCE